MQAGFKLEDFWLREKGMTPERFTGILRARNIQGVDAVSATNVNAQLLAPGTDAGRMLIITKAGLKKLDEKFGE